MNRRQFIQTTAVCAAALSARSAASALAAGSPKWPVGCFNRPWTKWSYDDTLDAMVAAGFKLTGLTTVHPGEAFTSSAATPEYLDGLKQRIARRGLAVNMSVLRLRPDRTLDESIADVRKQLEHAARLELKFMLTNGVDQPEQYDDFYRLMADAAPRAAKLGLQLAIKPHGGVSAAAADILRCLDKVGHANFKVWYDAGNILYYTGKDPLAELAPLACHVTGFCAKDCPGPKGEVMSQFGGGKVDFKALFAKLNSAGFNGPIMIEGVKVGATAAETASNAHANREFLERVLAAI